MNNQRYSRQSFLGENSQDKISNCRVGIVGLGGGGSHIIQQLAHLGFKKYEIFDYDKLELSNLNRTVGATLEDALQNIPKVKIAERVIKGLHPDAEVGVHECRWQNEPNSLLSCHILFGCVDSFDERRQLEIASRRNLIPLIDIGLGVVSYPGEAPYMAGQIILSAPGGPCMTCMGFLTESALAKEALDYGDAGPKPQVIWSNGNLASTAVGLAIEVLTNWNGKKRPPVYIDYRANENSMSVHARELYAPKESCPHFTNKNIGPVILKPL